MIILGLTGSIGMGKSTTLKMFESEGIKTYSADKAVHELYEGEAVPAIRAIFPNAIVHNKVDRKVLSQIILDNPEQLKQIEAIIHPMGKEKQLEFIKASQRAFEKLIVLDIPLLFETSKTLECDKICVVSASAAIQRERVLKRAGMTIKKFEMILSCQMRDEDKRKLADFVIDTNQDLSHVKTQVQEIIKILKLEHEFA
jgi:dephospho-CoA kinase